MNYKIIPVQFHYSTSGDTENLKDIVESKLNFQLMSLKKEDAPVAFSLSYHNPNARLHGLTLDYVWYKGEFYTRYDIVSNWTFSVYKDNNNVKMPSLLEPFPDRFDLRCVGDFEWSLVTQENFNLDIKYNYTDTYQTFEKNLRYAFNQFLLIDGETYKKTTEPHWVFFKQRTAEGNQVHKVDLMVTSDGEFDNCFGLPEHYLAIEHSQRYLDINNMVEPILTSDTEQFPHIEIYIQEALSFLKDAESYNLLQMRNALKDIQIPTEESTASSWQW